MTKRPILPLRTPRRHQGHEAYNDESNYPKIACHYIYILHSTFNILHFPLRIQEIGHLDVRSVSKAPCGRFQVVCRPGGRCQQLTLRLQVVCKLSVSIRPTFEFYIQHSTFYISRSGSKRSATLTSGQSVRRPAGVFKLPVSIRPTFTFYTLHSTFYILHFPLRIQELLDIGLIGLGLQFVRHDLIICIFLNIQNLRQLKHACRRRHGFLTFTRFRADQ